MLALKDDLTFEYLNQELSKKDFWAARAAKYQVSDIGGYSSFARRAKRAEDAAEKLRLVAPPAAAGADAAAARLARIKKALELGGARPRGRKYSLDDTMPPTWSDASSSP